MTATSFLVSGTSVRVSLVFDWVGGAHTTYMVTRMDLKVNQRKSKVRRGASPLVELAAGLKLFVSGVSSLWQTNTLANTFGKKKKKKNAEQHFKPVRYLPPTEETLLDGAF